MHRLCKAEMTDCQVTVKVTKPKKEENLSDEG